MNSLVSIIIPVYNCEAYIADCLDSILNQSYKKIEVIIVDDGSTDSTKFILENYKKISNIKLIFQENTGVSSARNLGIKLSSGKYICFVDGDDFIDENYIKRLVEEVDDSNLQLPIVGIQEFSEVNNDKKHIVNFEDRLFDFNHDADIFYRSNYLMLLYSPCNKLYYKKILDKYNIRFLVDLNYAEDFLFNLEYIGKVKNFKFIGEALYYYRRNFNSVTLKKDILRIKSEYNALKIINCRISLLEFSDIIKQKVIGNRIISFISMLMEYSIDINLYNRYSLFCTYMKLIKENKIYSRTSFIKKQGFILFLLNTNLYFLPFLYYYLKYRS